MICCATGLLSHFQNTVDAYLNYVDYCEFLVNSVDFFQIRFISKRFYDITCLLQQILYLCHSGVCHCSNKRDTVIMVGMGGRRYSKCRYFEYRDLLNVAFQEDSIHALYNILGFHGNM